MKAKYKVEWVNKIEYSCSHTIEAYSEHEAINICKSLDARDIDIKDECNNEDSDFEIELVEELKK